MKLIHLYDSIKKTPYSLENVVGSNIFNILIMLGASSVTTHDQQTIKLSPICSLCYF